jgi:hypothetical protein
MKGNIFLQKIRNENIHNNMSINNRYHKKKDIVRKKVDKSATQGRGCKY